MIKTLWVGQLLSVNTTNLKLAYELGSDNWKVLLARDMSSEDPYAVIVYFGSIRIGYLPSAVSRKLLKFGALADYTPALISYVKASSFSRDFSRGELIGVNIKIEVTSVPSEWTIPRENGGGGRVPFDPAFRVSVITSGQAASTNVVVDRVYIDGNVQMVEMKEADVQKVNVKEEQQETRTKKLTATPRKIQV